MEKWDGYPPNRGESGAHVIRFSPGNSAQAFWLSIQETWVLRNGVELKPGGMIGCRYIRPME
jgi:hypothetical protein